MAELCRDERHEQAHEQRDTADRDEPLGVRHDACLHSAFGVVEFGSAIVFSFLVARAPACWSHVRGVLLWDYRPSIARTIVTTSANPSERERMSYLLLARSWRSIQCRAARSASRCVTP